MLGIILESHHGRIIRYLISGGTAAVVDISVLFFLTHVGHFWYLGSSIAAFFIAFGVSFTMQKFFTFNHNSKEGMHIQALIYLVVTVANLGINTLLMYCLVSGLGVHYILSQILAGGTIAIYSFFVYKHFIFRSSLS